MQYSFKWHINRQIFYRGGLHNNKNRTIDRYLIGLCISKCLSFCGREGMAMHVHPINYALKHVRMETMKYFYLSSTAQ